MNERFNKAIETRRLGTITVSGELLADVGSFFDLVMMDVLIIDNLRVDSRDLVKFTGYSDHFDALEEDEEIPEYWAFSSPVDYVYASNFSEDFSVVVRGPTAEFGRQHKPNRSGTYAWTQTQTS